MADVAHDVDRMTVETSDILQPGAVIVAVERLGPWAKITTDIGTIYFAGDVMTHEQQLECPICGEHRLCEVITTAKRSIGFCKICGKPFPLKASRG